MTALPEFIGTLPLLENLNLYNNQLTTFPSCIEQLQRLQNLDFRYNRLMTLPEYIGKFEQLQCLLLIGNQLTTLPESIGQLRQLQRLDLRNNQLISLPESVRQLIALKELYLHGNIGLGLTDEILADDFSNAIRDSKILDYYFRLRASKRPLNEAKLILVGRGAVGKTSIVNRLVLDKFEKDEKKTEGIQITDWRILLNNEDVRLNIWDFGGQEIMHATHKFFLTRSVCSCAYGMTYRE